MIGLEAQITELNLHMISKTSENEQIHQKIQSQIQEKQEEWNSLEKKYKSQIDLLENEVKNYCLKF